MSLAAAASTIGQCTSCAIVSVVFVQPRDQGAALCPLSLAGGSDAALPALSPSLFFVEASRRRGCALPPLVRDSLPSSTVRCPSYRYCCLLGLRQRHGALPPLVRSPLPSLAERPLSNALARHGPGPKLRRWCQFRAWATPCQRKTPSSATLVLCCVGIHCLHPLFGSLLCFVLFNGWSVGKRGWCQ